MLHFIGSIFDFIVNHPILVVIIVVINIAIYLKFCK